MATPVGISESVWHWATVGSAIRDVLAANWRFAPRRLEVDGRMVVEENARKTVCWKVATTARETLLMAAADQSRTLLSPSAVATFQQTVLRAFSLLSTSHRNVQ